jgi:hypothetical protein
MRQAPARVQAHTQAQAWAGAGAQDLVPGIDGTPQLAAQRSMLARIEQSPPLASQRRRIGALQRKGGKFLVEGDEAPARGQVHKDVFVRELRAAVRQMAARVLASIGQTADNCPYIAFWFQFYGGKDAAHVEHAVGRYAPEALEATTWQECIARVVERVRQGFEAHVASGSLEGVPEELPQVRQAPAAQPPVQAVAQLCKGGERDETVATHVVDVAPVSDLTLARRAFRAAQVINFTDIRYQFYSSSTVSFSTGTTTMHGRREAPPDHLVNKWERAENGEKGLGNYTNTEDETGEANDPEATHLEIDRHTYRNLPAQQKMQFAILDYKRDGRTIGGWGRSYFVIRRAKAEADGFIHFGDSGETTFPGRKGSFAQFEQRLAEDPIAQAVLAGKQAGPAWIEVNLRNGVAIPGDIEKVVVSNAELQEMAGQLSVQTAKDELAQRFDNVEYKD